jgi:hypothetical protein
VSAQSRYSFWGRATLDGTPLAAGNTIYATIDNQIRGQITTQIAGSYGSENGPYLEVPITNADIGKTIRFQTATGAEGDQSQLVVSGLKVLKNINSSQNLPVLLISRQLRPRGLFPFPSSSPTSHQETRNPGTGTSAMEQPLLKETRPMYIPETGSIPSV